MEDSKIKNAKNAKSNQDSKLADFEKLKSKYILKYIFDYFERNKLLEIVKYNKKMKKKLELSVKDYKDYSKIEIELIPANNKYGKFINILENSNKINYHIYFNDSKKNSKKYCLTKYDNVKKVRIIIDNQIKSFYELFSNCECIESITFKRFYRRNITNMAYMFYN